MIQFSNFLYFIPFSITVFNWFIYLIGAHWNITCGHVHGIGIYNKVWNAFCFHHCRPEVLTLVASHVQLQALQGAQWHFWTSNLMETYFINEQICNYAAISKCKVQHTKKSSLICVAGARNALQALSSLCRHYTHLICSTHSQYIYSGGGGSCSCRSVGSPGGGWCTVCSHLAPVKVISSLYSFVVPQNWRAEYMIKYSMYIV